MFEEIKEKEKLTEYLEVLLRYLTKSKAGVTDEDLYEAVNVLESGGEIMKTIEEQWTEREKEKKNWDILKTSIKRGFSIDVIEELTGLPVERIKQMKEEILRGNENHARA